MNSAGQSSPLDFNRIVAGVIRAAKLDKTFFQEAERDVTYGTDALAVVVIVSVVGALGQLLSGSHSILGFLWAAVWGVVGFFLWSFLVSWVGTTFFKGQGDFGEVYRCLGFAYGPQVVGILAFIPCLGALAGLIGWVWSMVIGFFAIREALDQDNANAALTIIISGVIVIVIGLVIGGVILGGAVLGGLLTGGY